MTTFMERTKLKKESSMITFFCFTKWKENWNSDILSTKMKLQSILLQDSNKSFQETKNWGQMKENFGQRLNSWSMISWKTRLLARWKPKRANHWFNKKSKINEPFSYWKNIIILIEFCYLSRDLLKLNILNSRIKR